MPIRNAKRPTMISEGEIVGLTDEEKKVLKDAGIAGDKYTITEDGDTLVITENY